MYTSIEVQNFKCHKRLKIEELGRVNLIGGKNNSGKTALLEALFVHGGAFHPELLKTIGRVRKGHCRFPKNEGRREEYFWKDFFHFFNLSRNIRIDTLWKEGSSVRELSTSVSYINSYEDLEEFLADHKDRANFIRELSVREQAPKYLLIDAKRDTKARQTFALLDSKGDSVYPYGLAPMVKTTLVTSDKPSSVDLAKDFSQLVKDNRRIAKEMESTLQHLFGFRESFELQVLSPNEVSELHYSMDENTVVPVHNLGEGAVKLLSMAIGLHSSTHAAICIDEIENGIHYSILPKLWELVFEIAEKNDVQVFATTHSYECIKAAQEVAQTKSDTSFAYHKLVMGEDETRVISLTGTDIENSEELNMEIR